MGKNQEKIKEALDRIEAGLATISSDENWLSYLCFQSKFYNYSFGNTMLIYSQNPQATYVKGYKAWNQLGRYVKKGSRGLAILAPCFRKTDKKEQEEEEIFYQKSEDEKKNERVISGFRVTYVYDIADTEGSDEYLPVLVKGLAGNSETERNIYERILEVVSKEHTVKEVTGTAAKGSYNLETGVICVRGDLDYLQKIKTLLHEYAHSIDFILHPEQDVRYNRRELIAESVAYVVGVNLGLDTSSYSMSYIKSWMQDTDELKIIADTVQKISAQIIKTLEQFDAEINKGIKDIDEGRVYGVDDVESEMHRDFDKTGR